MHFSLKAYYTHLDPYFFRITQYSKNLSIYVFSLTRENTLYTHLKIQTKLGNLILLSLELGFKFYFTGHPVINATEMDTRQDEIG